MYGRRSVVVAVVGGALFFGRGRRAEAAVLACVGHREVTEDVFQGLRVALELEEDPALVDDELEEIGAEVRVLLGGELEGVRALVRGDLADLLHALYRLEGLFDLGGLRRLTATDVALAVRRFLDAYDVADLAALRANLVQGTVGHHA